MKRASLIGSAVAAGALWIAAAPASATTFCVPNFPACPAGATVEPDIQTAVTTNDSDGNPDEVLVAPQPVTASGSIHPTGTDSLTIRGAGPDQSVLTTTANTDIYLLNLFDRDTVVQDLTVEIPQSFPDDNVGPGTGVLLNGNTLINVDIRSLNDDGASTGLAVYGGGTFNNGDIYEGPGGMLGDAIRTEQGGGNLFVERARIVGANHPYLVRHNMVATARSVEVVDPAQSGFRADAGFLIIDNSIVRSNAAAIAVVAGAGATGATVTADHLTGVYTGPGTAGVPAVASAALALSTGSPSLTVTNSIFRGYETGALREAQGAGSADLTVRYSNLTDNAMEFGPGTLTLENNIDEDPLFANAAGSDFHLSAGSPSIDAGDPAAATPTIDFDLFLRPQDGNGDGIAVRDQGAYEFPTVDPPDPPDTTPPDTRIESGPGGKSQLKKRRATFAFSSTEAGSSFECRLDKAAFAACTSPTAYKRLKRGKHTFSVRAIDAAGNADDSAATKKFKIKKKKRKH